MRRQILPEKPDYDRDQRALLARVGPRIARGADWDARIGGSAVEADVFNPYPFGVPIDDLYWARSFGRVLADALRAVVEAYPSDARIRRYLAVAPALHEIVLRLADRAYRPGSFRPDFLYDLEGCPRVCELNARYPLSSLYGATVLSEEVRHLPHVSGVVDLPPLGPIVEAISGTFRTGEPLAVVYGRVPGYDVHHFARSFEHRLVHVSAIRRDGRALVADGFRFRQVVLQIDRTELLDLRPDVLDFVVEHATCVNDPRTLILVHDKRMLGVLRDRRIMADYLGPAPCALLRRHIIPTRPLDDRDFVDLLARDPEPWVLKQNSGGRGVGMFIGSKTPATTWRALLGEQADAYHAQAFLEQKLFPIYDRIGGSVATRMVQVIGSMPCFGDRCFGFGVVRSARKDEIINVFEGRGTLLAPAILDEA